MIREKQIVCSESISEKSSFCSLPSSGVWVPKAHALGPRRFPQNQPAGAHPQEWWPPVSPTCKKLAPVVTLGLHVVCP